MENTTELLVSYECLHTLSAWSAAHAAHVADANNLQMFLNKNSVLTLSFYMENTTVLLVSYECLHTLTARSAAHAALLAEANNLQIF